MSGPAAARVLCVIVLGMAPLLVVDRPALAEDDSGALDLVAVDAVVDAAVPPSTPHPSAPPIH